MANALFDQGKHELVNGLLWTSDDIKVILVDTGAHTSDLSADTVLDDITGAAIIATSANLTVKTAINGVLDAADFTFTAVSGVSVEAMIIYKDTGVDTTSPLLMVIDTATGLPVTPSGGDITVTWDSGANKIMAL